MHHAHKLLHHLMCLLEDTHPPRGVPTPLTCCCYKKTAIRVTNQQQPFDPHAHMPTITLRKSQQVLHSGVRHVALALYYLPAHHEQPGGGLVHGG